MSAATTAPRDRVRFHSRSDAFEVASMLNDLCAIFGVKGFAMVRKQCTPSQYVYFIVPVPVAEMTAHWFAWALGVRGWDSSHHGDNGVHQWFCIEEVIQPEAFQ